MPYRGPVEGEGGSRAARQCWSGLTLLLSRFVAEVVVPPLRAFAVDLFFSSGCNLVQTLPDILQPEPHLINDVAE